MTGPDAPRFAQRLASACDAHQSCLLIEIAPWPEKIPYPLLRHDDPALPYSKAVIDATAPYACGYVFDLAAFLCVGASGAIALERAAAYVPAPLLRVLHGPFATGAYRRAASESAFAVDAVTLATTDPQAIEAYGGDGGLGALIDGGLVAHVDSATLPLGCGLCAPPEADGTRAVRFSGIPEAPEHLLWLGAAVGFASRADDYQDVIRAVTRSRLELSRTAPL